MLNPKQEYDKIRNNIYYEKNKVYLKEKAKLYRLENKEKVRASKKKAYNTAKGLKQNRVRGWKNQGIICDYDVVYDIYINTHICDNCKKEFGKSTNRNLDHNHETGEIRGIICNRCNGLDLLK